VDSDLPPRLRRYPIVAVARLPWPLRAATTFRARLLGLAGLPSLPDGLGLLLPATRSVHTVGMRFALDLIWIDREGNVVRVDESVPPMRVRTCRRAWGVVELAAGGAH
jgi:uncharacterized membrane protein (UPF0127 family)